MECVDIVYSSVVKDVNKEVNSVVHWGSNTVKTYNFLKSDTVETLSMVQNDSDTVETFESVRLVKIINKVKTKGI